jgi:hypothetical protein
MSEVMAYGENEDFDRHEAEYLYGPGAGRKPRRLRMVAESRLGLRLYTATIAATQDNMMVQAFHASIAGSEGEVRGRIAGRYGPHLAQSADVRIGVHRAAPLVVALVPPAVVEMIWRVQRYSAARHVREFSVDIQQCIRA